jgi:hypothetical protein
MDVLKAPSPESHAFVKAATAFDLDTLRRMRDFLYLPAAQFAPQPAQRGTRAQMLPDSFRPIAVW